MKIRELLLSCMIVCASIVSFAQNKECQNITVQLEVLQEGAASVLKIQISETGKFKIRIIDLKGNVQEVKQGSIRGLAKGAYDVVIFDENNLSRCPFSKRIKV